MPRLSGPDLVHRLSATWPGLKAVFVTGYADEAEIGSLSEQERRSVLPKPLTPTELQTEVRRMLDDPGVPAR